MGTPEELYIVKNYRWNFVVNSINVAFFNVAMTLSSIITFLPLFLERLGASNVLIGLIPSVAFIGFQLPGLVSANIVESIPSKLRFVQKITILERLPLLGLAFIALYLAVSNPGLTIALTFVCLILITFTSGTITPAWFDYVAKVTPPRKLGTFFATGNGIGGMIGILASLMAAYFLKTYAFPINYYYCFLWGFVAIMVSGAMTFLGREPKVQPTQAKTKLMDYYRKMPQLLRNDKKLQHYIIFRNLQCLGSMATTFFAVYGVKHLNFADESAGWMTLTFLASQSFFFFLWGFIGDRFGHRLVLFFGAIGLTMTSVLAFFFQSYFSLMMIFLFLGWYHSAMGTSGFAFLRDIAPKGRYPTYLALNNGLSAIAAFSAPVLGGFIADLYSYKLMFLIAFILSFIALIWFIWVSRSKNPQKLTVRL